MVKGMPPTIRMAAIWFVFIFSSNIAILQAQTELQPLKLQKGNMVITIPVGDWIVATDESGLFALASGNLVLKGDSILKIQPVNEPERLVIIDEIGILYLWEQKGIGYYTVRGFLSGGKIGAYVGIPMFLMAILSGSAPQEEAKTMDYYLGGLVEVTLTMAIAGAYLGTIIGTINGIFKVVFGFPASIPYPIGPGEWEIVGHPRIDIEN